MSETYILNLTKIILRTTRFEHYTYGLALEGKYNLFKIKHTIIIGNILVLSSDALFMQFIAEGHTEATCSMNTLLHKQSLPISVPSNEK